MINFNIADEWGGIDKKIKSAVYALNQIGIPTAGSCEGHTDDRSPAPWISVRNPHEPKDRKSSRYQKWQNKSTAIRKQIDKFLNEFYKKRGAAVDVRIKIMNAHGGFWLHNGGTSFDRWRKKVKSNATKIKMGKIPAKKIVTSQEKSARMKKLAYYQKEMKTFAVFLKNKSSD